MQVNGESFNTTGSAHVFSVRPGRAYRFRTIGGTTSWPPRIEVAVSGHELTLIAVDGSPIAPVNSTAFRVTPGERVDFVLTAGGASRWALDGLPPSGRVGGGAGICSGVALAGGGVE